MSFKKKYCTVCGQPFATSANSAKYCDSCRAQVYKDLHEKARKERIKRLKEKQAEIPAENTASKDHLSAKLKALREEGISYAEAQRRDSLERFGRLEL